MSSGWFLSIFTSLMKNKVNHIFRSVTITFLMAGFLAHLIVPFSSQAQKTAFTRWLNHNVVSSGNESEVELRNTIKELPEQTGDFWKLVQEASELVVSHKDNFKRSLSNPGETGKQTNSSWLIEQWNSFQNQESGFNSVLIESVKALSKWVPQNLNFASLEGNRGTYQQDFFNELFFYSFRTSTDLLKPLISGISINAP